MSSVRMMTTLGGAGDDDPLGSAFGPHAPHTRSSTAAATAVRRRFPIVIPWPVCPLPLGAPAPSPAPGAMPRSGEPEFRLLRRE
ncbi:MAG: hypothetical protein OXG81_02840 [Acidobacteria bacterium]|nr:hypothetical protein [Acidobacteriota bacterium]